MAKSARRPARSGSEQQAASSSRSDKTKPQPNSSAKQRKSARTRSRGSAVDKSQARAHKQARGEARRILKDPKEAAALARKATAKADKHSDGLEGVLDDVKTLTRLIRAYSKEEYRDIPWKSMVAGTGAIVYFVWPFDAIPDAIPGIGYVDDVLVLSFVVNAIAADLDAYRTWEGSAADKPRSPRKKDGGRKRATAAARAGHQPSWEYGGDSLARLPYAQRQRIAVVDDEIAYAERVARETAAVQETADWTAILETLVVSLVPGGPAVKGAAVLAMAGYRAFERLRAAGVELLTVARSEAERLQFPPGHPRDGVVYVGDPAIANCYYPAADFHRRVFEHKFSEAVHLLMALGATELRVELERGWGVDVAGEIASPIPRAPVNVTAEGSTKKSQASTLLFEAHLEPHAPTVPPELVWHDHEPTWRQVARGRIEYGMQDFALTVRYSEDFGIDAKFAAKVAKAKLSLGGDFTKQTDTAWRITGTFGAAG